MLLYLAGAMSEFDRQGKFEKAVEWRLNASRLLKEFRIKTFNPCDNYEINKEYQLKGIVNQNLTYLKNSDILLLNLEELDKSPGTMFEIFFAYMKHTPVIAFGENYLYGTQPHVTESISMKFKDSEEAIDYITSMFGQEN